VIAFNAPPLSLTEAAALCVVAVVAGAVNSVAGGGTLLTFPALLWFGTASLVANATNTVAMFLGTAGSIVSYRRQIAAIRPWLLRLLPASALGGWLGGVLLTRTSEQLFTTLVPFLILFATLVFIGQGAVRRLAGISDDAPLHPQRRVLWLAMLMQFLVSVYGGYFGAGIGILMLASLGFSGLRDLHAIIAAKNVLAGVINLVAAIWFIASGLIDWPRAAVLTVGTLCGYFIGAHYAQRVPQAWVRRAVVIIGLGIAAVQFWRQFLTVAH